MSTDVDHENEKNISAMAELRNSVLHYIYTLWCYTFKVFSVVENADLVWKEG